MNPVYIPPFIKKEQTGEYVEAEKIMNIVQEYFGIAREDLLNKKRKQIILYPRQICIWLLNKYSFQSMAGIGVIFGHKDRSSAENAVSVVDNYLSQDVQVRKQIGTLSAKIEELINK